MLLDAAQFVVGLALFVWRPPRVAVVCDLFVEGNASA